MVYVESKQKRFGVDIKKKGDCENDYILKGDSGAISK